MTTTSHLGDCLATLRTLPAESGVVSIDGGSA